MSKAPVFVSKIGQDIHDRASIKRLTVMVDKPILCSNLYRKKFIQLFREVAS